jgi:hypothetical protein
MTGFVVEAIKSVFGPRGIHRPKDIVPAAAAETRTNIPTFAK